MKTLLCIFVASGIAWGATQPVLEQNRCDFTFTVTSPNTVTFDNREQKCLYWTLGYYSSGFSALSVELDGAPDPGTKNPPTTGWVTLQSITGVSLTSGANPSTTTGQQSATFTGYAPWVRINFSSATGTGSVNATAYGDRNGQGGAGGGGGGGGGCTSPCPVEGVDSTGIAPSVPPVATAGLNSSGVTIPLQYCDRTAVIALSGTGDTQVIAASGSTVIRVCRISLTTSANTNVQVDYGTGSNCATGITHLTGVYSSIATFSEPSNNAYWTLPASKALCISQSAASTTGGTVSYAQY